MRRESATVTELSRVELLAGLPGETLARLGERMERQDVPAGTRVAPEGADERFYVVLSGLLTAPGAMFRPGDAFGEVGPEPGAPRAASVQAMTPATVASCDRATYEELVASIRPA